MSAKFRSVFLKYNVPVMKIIIEKATDKINPGKNKSNFEPSKAHLKPSITPTRGFREYSILHSTGTRLLLNPMGEINRPSCIRNGTMYLKSLNLTLKAENHNPAPRAGINASTTNKGNVSISHPGMIPYHIISTTIIKNVVMKSTKLTAIELIGSSTLGKYTFVIRFEFEIRLKLLSESELEKNDQGSKPANTISGYGTPSWGSFAIFPKTTENIIIVNNGFNKLHNIPTTVCLYLTIMSRQLRKYSSSLYRQISLK